MAVEWLAQGFPKGTCSSVASCDLIAFSKPLSWQIALELLYQECSLTARIHTKHFCFGVNEGSVAETSLPTSEMVSGIVSVA